MMYVKVKYWTLILFLFSVNFLPAQDNKARKYLIEGNKNYLAASYDEAAANYLRAVQEGEDSYKSNFNLGNAMYKLKKYDDALSQYEKSVKLATDNIDRSNAYFNIGDSYYQKKEYARAAEAFKKVLQINPKDERARYNYTLAKQKAKEQQEDKGQQQQDQSANGQDKQKNGGNKESQEQQQGQSQNQFQDKKENNQQGQSGGKGEQQSGQGSGDEEGQHSIENLKSHTDNTNFPEKEKARKQYYEGILGAMEEQEKRAQQKIINKKVPPSQNQRGKDW
ncbi:MAG: tetratricopeptide repeat protein [Flavobacteriaceae bacterium]|jgi:tetratricopeptide (TPR) repeat protein|nr:tetratricopeptide repeat protein [Flavobacteriaceae bacterium]